MVALFVLPFALAACPPPTPVTPGSDGDPGTGTVTEDSALFEAADGSEGVYVFRTNDTAYSGGSGWSFWTLVGEDSRPFPGYSAALVKTSGNSRAGYGIVFCHEGSGSAETMLVAMINVSGEYLVGEVVGAEFSALVPWTSSGRLKTGYNQRNEVAVFLSDGAFSLWLNGESVETFEDEEPPLHTGGRCGFLAVVSPLDDFPGTPVRVTFEEL